MTITVASASDAGEIMTVQRAAYVSEAQLYDNPHLSALSEQLESVRKAIEDEVVLVARLGTRVVGAVRGRLEGPVCHVGRLVVAPDLHGKGIGKHLLLAIEEQMPASARRFALHTGGKSASNLGLYVKLEYVRVREERGLVHLEKIVSSPAAGLPSVASVIYQHPLAYLVGIEGLALLRSFTGEYDREFVEARLAEVRRLLDDSSLASAAVEANRVDTVAGYRVWSRTYDEPGNGAFDTDTPIIEDILDGLPKGVALDAACGTGRLTRMLVERGHRVIGVDSSPDMLERARIPGVELLLGDLCRLPLRDNEVDLVSCALALTHVPDLAPVLAEFARVLRPGGHLVISDIHPEGLLRGSIPAVRDRDGRPGRVASYRRLVGDYLRAALPVGLQPRRCEEPLLTIKPDVAVADSLGPWELWPWSLMELVPEATRAANTGVPAMIIWLFQLT